MDDETVEVWNIWLTTMMAQFEHVCDAHFSQDGSMIALQTADSVVVKKHAGDKTTDWEDLGTVPFEVPFWRCMPEFLPGHQALAWIAPQDDEYQRYFHLWDLTTGTDLAGVERCNYQAIRFKFSPDGQFVALYIVTSEPGNIIWEVSSGKEIAAIAGSLLDFSPTKNLIVAGNDDNVAIWELPSMKKRCQLEKQATDNDRDCLWSMAISTSGIIAASMTNYSNNKTALIVWDIADGSRIANIDTDGGSCFDLSVSDDNKHVVTKRGRLPLPLTAGCSDSERLIDRSIECLFVGQTWIRQGHENLLWIPPSYRSSEVAVEGQTIALLERSNAPIFLEIDLANTPLVRKY
ncbi:Fc.00g107640.m01.CDS01 [Cosmosporella sp. VM-42]